MVKDKDLVEAVQSLRRSGVPALADLVLLRQLRVACLAALALEANPWHLKVLGALKLEEEGLEVII